MAPVYEDGAKTVTLKGERIAEEFQELVEQYVARTYARRVPEPVTAEAQHERIAERRCQPCDGGVAAAIHASRRKPRSQQLSPRLAR